MGAEGLQSGMVRVPRPQAEAEQSTRYTPEPGEHSGGCGAGSWTSSSGAQQRCLSWTYGHFTMSSEKFVGRYHSLKVKDLLGKIELGADS